MKLSCSQCSKTFNDKDWLDLHCQQQHGQARISKKRGVNGGRQSRKAKHFAPNSSAWVKTAPSSSTLMNHYRPAEKPKFESELPSDPKNLRGIASAWGRGSMFLKK